MTMMIRQPRHVGNDNDNSSNDELLYRALLVYLNVLITVVKLQSFLSYSVIFQKHQRKWQKKNLEHSSHSPSRWAAQRTPLQWAHPLNTPDPTSLLFSSFGLRRPFSRLQIISGQQLRNYDPSPYRIRHPLKKKKEKLLPNSINRPDNLKSTKIF